jgi:hypothetical protein
MPNQEPSTAEAARARLRAITLKRPRLTDDDIRFIRDNRNRISEKELGRMFNRSPSTIQQIMQRYIYAHVPVTPREAKRRRADYIKYLVWCTTQYPSGSLAMARTLAELARVRRLK